MIDYAKRNLPAKKKRTVLISLDKGRWLKANSRCLRVYIRDRYVLDIPMRGLIAALRRRGLIHE